MPLPLKLTAIFPDESIPGAMLRIAELNGYATVADAVTAIGGDRRELAGPETARAVLVEVGPTLAQALAASSAEFVDGRRKVRIGDQRIARKDYSTRFRRRCPACLGSDGYHRAALDCGAVTACPVHGVAIEDACLVCGCKVRWSSGTLFTCVEGHDLTGSGRPVDADEHAYSRYVAGRLGWGVKPLMPLLDQAELHEAVAAMDAIGRAAVWGHRAVPPDPAAEASQTVGRIRARGFAILSDWPRGFCALLDGLADSMGGGRRQWGLLATYGWLYHWIATLPNTSLTATLRGELAKHSAGRVMIKSHVQGAEFHETPGALLPLRRAQTELGIGYRKLTRLSRALGLVRQHRDGGQPLGLTAAHLDEIREVVSDGLDLTSAGEYLGESPKIVLGLVREGLIERVATMGAAYSATYLVKASEIDRLVTALHGNLPVVDAPEPGHYPLHKACRRSGLKSAEALALLRQGRVSAKGLLAGLPALSCLLFDPRELRAAYVVGRRTALSLAQVARRLGLGERDISSLVRTGHLSAEYRVEAKKRFLAFDSEAVERFDERYVKATGYADRLGTNPYNASKRLAFLGLRPAIEGNGLGILLYDRKQADAFVGRLTKEMSPQETRAEFWDGLQEALKRKGATFPWRDGLDHFWLQSGGAAGLNTFVRFRAYPNRIGVGIVMSAEAGEAVRSYVLARRRVLEASVGCELEHLVKHRGGEYLEVWWSHGDPYDRGLWPQIQEWIADRLVPLNESILSEMALSGLVRVIRRKPKRSVLPSEHGGGAGAGRQVCRGGVSLARSPAPMGHGAAAEGPAADDASSSRRGAEARWSPTEG